MEHEKFTVIKSIVSEVICRALRFVGAKISEQVLNDMSNDYADKIIAELPPAPQVLSEGEIEIIMINHFNKWAKEDGFTNGIGTLRRQELAAALSGRIPKGQESICKTCNEHDSCDNVRFRISCPSHHSPEPPKLPEEIKDLLWDYLMHCLAIHHSVENRIIKTIPEAQERFSNALLDYLKAKGV